MNEENLIISLENTLKGLKVDPNNKKSAPLFKKVIANNVPIWTSVEQSRAVCFYIPETNYEEPNGLTIPGKSSVLIYIYNKHKARGLSLDDILTPYIDAIKAEVSKLPSTDSSILNAYVSKVKRDGGTVLPYTVAEIAIEISFMELITCP